MTDQLAPEFWAFAEDIARLLADDHAELSIREIPAEPGFEPGVVFCVRGVLLFRFQRDEFLEAMYWAGTDAMAELQSAGLSLAVASTGPVE